MAMTSGASTPSNPSASSNCDQFEGLGFRICTLSKNLVAGAARMLRSVRVSARGLSVDVWHVV